MPDGQRPADGVSRIGAPIIIDAVSDLFSASGRTGADPLGVYRAKLNRARRDLRQRNPERALISASGIQKRLESQTRRSSSAVTTSADDVARLVAATWTVVALAHDALGSNEQAQEASARAVEIFHSLLAARASATGEGAAQELGDYGLALAIQGRHVESIAPLRDAVDGGAGTPEIFRYLGLALKHEGELREAEAWLRRAVELDPSDVIACVALAEVQQNTGQEDEAVTTYVQTVTLLADAGRIDEALSLVRTALTAYSYEDTLRYLEAWCLATAGRNDQAMASVDSLLASRPDSVEALRLKSQILADVGRGEEALNVIEAALDVEPHDAAVLGTKGWLLTRLGRPVEAIPLLREAQEAGAPAIWIHSQLVLAMLGSGRFEEALAEAEQTAKLDPSLPEPVAQQADALHALGRHEQALAMIEQALTMAPELLPALQIKADVLYSMGRLQEALAVLERTTALDPLDAWSLGLRGEILQDLGRRDDAIESLLRANELAPLSRRIIVPLAVALNETGRHAEALQTVDDFLVHGQADAGVLALRAAVLRDLDRFDEAITVADEALRQEPTRAIALIVKVESLGELGRLPEALEAVEALLRLQPNHLGGLVTRARLLDGLERLSEAAPAYELVLASHPGRTSTYVELIGLYRRLGEIPRALSVAERGLALLPGDLTLLIQHAELLVDLDRAEEALNVVDRIVSDHPDLVAAWRLRGEILQALNRSEEALASLDLAQEREPEDAWGLMVRGRVLLALGRAHDAVEVLEQATLLVPDLAPAYHYLGVAHEDLSEYDAALAAYGESLQRQPGYIPSLAGKGNVLTALEKPAEALAAYDAVLSLLRDDTTMSPDPEAEAEAEHLRAVNLRRLQRYDEAMKAIDRVLAARPDVAMYRGERALILASLGRSSEALAEAEKIASEQPQIYYDIGDVLYDRGQYEQAIVAFDRQVASDPKNDESIRMKAYALTVLRRHAEGVPTFEMLRSRYEDQAWAWSDLAFGYHQSGRCRDALEAVDRALALDANDPWSLRRKGEILCDVAEFQAAIPLLELPAEHQPTRWDALGLLAWAYENLGRQLGDEAYRRARDYYKTILDEKTEDDHYALKGLANTLRMLRDPAATPTYERVIREASPTASGNGDLLALIGWCYIWTGKYDHAVRNLVEAISASLDPMTLFSQFDLALALLCADRPAPALHEYQRGIQQTRSVDDLRQRGLLTVAQIDLEEAIALKSNLAGVDEVARARVLISEALDALPPVGSTLSAGGSKTDATPATDR